MPAPGATDALQVPRLRSIFGALALVVCLCATVAAGTPLAQAMPARQKAVRRHPRRAHPAVRCAKRSSFHASGGHPRRKHHPTSCAKRGSGKRGSGKRRGSHHSKPGKRNPHRAKRHGSSTVKPADAGTCTGADLKPTQENIEVIRAATLCLIDQERAGNGEAPLQLNARLQQAAQEHTESMASEGYFEHDGPGGDTPLSRMIAAGYIYSSHVGYEVGANILDARFRDTAVGVSPKLPSSLAGGEPGGIYTQDFGVIITA